MIFLGFNFASLLLVGWKTDWEVFGKLRVWTCGFWKALKERKTAYFCWFWGVFRQNSANSCLFSEPRNRRFFLKNSISDSVIRWFESSYPSQIESCYRKMITTLLFYTDYVITWCVFCSKNSLKKGDLGPIWDQFGTKSPASDGLIAWKIIVFCLSRSYTSAGSVPFCNWRNRGRYRVARLSIAPCHSCNSLRERRAEIWTLGFHRHFEELHKRFVYVPMKKLPVKMAFVLCERA